jgi:Bacterial Ig-like domain
MEECMTNEFVWRTRAVMLGLCMAAGAACGTGDSFLTPLGSGTGTDLTPPTVASVVPLSGATNVPTNATITVTFSENVDSASVTNTAFVLTPGITGTISVSGAVAIFTPTPGLPPSTIVNATVSNVKDRAGNTMAGPYNFFFTTTTGP